MSDLSDFFQTISVAKKQQKEELESILGSSFEDLCEDVFSTIQQGKVKKSNKKVKNTEVITENFIKEIPQEVSHQEDFSSSIDYYTQFINNEVKEKPIQEETNSVAGFKELRNLVLQLMRDVQLHGGGGEVNLAYMDMPITSVTSASYNVSLNDYYVGVNYSGAVTITLPTADREGKVFIIKDELGEASKGTNRYITILPTGSDLIDGRDRAILAFDYGSLTFIWKNNSWRVV